MKRPLSTQKLRGGYYTPKEIADFLCAWAIGNRDVDVLEPSCGDGVFLEAAAFRLVSLGAQAKDLNDQLTGLEVHAGEAHKAVARLKALQISRPSIYNDDFFVYCRASLASSRRFDAVVGNPPFIRYQNFLEPHRATAFAIMRQAGLRPNRLTNAWTPFVVAATLLLRDGGRLAMVIPAELLQVNYAAELRRFLSANYRALTMFTFRRLVFGDIQQEVVLLCGERGRIDSEDAWIRTVELNGLADVASHQHTEFERAELKTMDHSTEKWTQYFLSNQELELIRQVRRHPKLTALGDVASVDVGIVTGMNEFFVLKNSHAHRLRLSRYTEPLATRSAQLRGITFSRKDWQRSLEEDAPVLLLNLPPRPKEEIGDAARRYILDGERQGFHKGYKCRIRKLWHVLPSVWIPDAFLLRQIHSYPKLVLNCAETTCTDTIHRVRFKDRREGRKIATAFLNSLTFAFAEIMGRSYGGGVLELEPNEADHLPVPLAAADGLRIEYADHGLRNGEDIDRVLDRHDALLLGDGLGISRPEILALRGIWSKLRDRRIRRKFIVRDDRQAVISENAAP